MLRSIISLLDVEDAARPRRGRGASTRPRRRASRHPVLSARLSSRISSISLLDALVLDRDHELDAVVEVARHQVGRAGEDAGLAGALERVDARVLEEAAEHRDDLDVLGDALDARAQGADAAHVELRPRRRPGRPGRAPGSILGSSSEFIFIRIRAGRSGEWDSIVRSISVEQPVGQVERSDQRLAVVLRAARSRSGS